MNALATILRITNKESLMTAGFKFCLVDENKRPHKINNSLVCPNNVDDFVNIEELTSCKNIDKYAGIGVSIQASNVCAIDVDHCFKNAFDLSSADSRALDIIDMFKDKAYIEFSFSGKGLRVFFKQADIPSYTTKYYIKAEKYGIEYYQPSNSARYVTITGHTIYDNDVDTRDDFSDTILNFLNRYMVRTIKFNRANSDNTEDNRSLDDLMKLVKSLYLRNFIFQTRWFDEAHYLQYGMSHESQDDYQLMALIYENITQNRDKLRLVFEQSPYFKTKDTVHKLKWTKSDYRYFNYQFDKISGRR